MAKSHLLALPEQELAALLRAAQNPQYAALFAQVPVFHVALQAARAQANTPSATGSRACPCCGGKRFVHAYSKACNANWFSIPHLDFSTDYTYMPSNLGIPGDGDGPSLTVCLDCGRVQDTQYPLSDDELRRRIKRYQEGLL
jgi:hypothetical protein